MRTKELIYLSEEELLDNTKYSHNDLEAAYNLAMFERKN
jgi:hypothetical protein